MVYYKLNQLLLLHNILNNNSLNNNQILIFLYKPNLMETEVETITIIFCKLMAIKKGKILQLKDQIINQKLINQQLQEVVV